MEHLGGQNDIFPDLNCFMRKSTALSAEQEDCVRKQRIFAIVGGIVAAVLLVGAGYVVGNGGFPAIFDSSADENLEIDPNASDEEIQAILDKRANESRITASVAPTFEQGEDGWIRPNFAVKGDNKFPEQLEIEQNGKTIYTSEVMKPGEVLEWAYVPDAVLGRATAVVYAIDKNGQRSGTPIHIDVAIV